MANSFGCTRFSGKKEEYDAWKIKVEDWMDFTEVEKKRQGLIIRVGLEKSWR